MTFNGVPAPAVTVVDGDTAIFTVPDGLPEGMITVTIAAGAVSDVQGTPVDEFSGDFHTDLSPPTRLPASLPVADGADVRMAETLHENAFGGDLGLDESVTAMNVVGADDASTTTTENDVWDGSDAAWLSGDLESAVSSLVGDV